MFILYYNNFYHLKVEMNNTIKRINILQNIIHQTNARNRHPFMFINNKCDRRWYDRMVRNGTARPRQTNRNIQRINSILETT